MVSCAGVRIRGSLCRVLRVLALPLRSDHARGSSVPAGSLMRGENRRLPLIGQMRANGRAVFCVCADLFFLHFLLKGFGHLITAPEEAHERWEGRCPFRAWTGIQGTMFCITMCRIVYVLANFRPSSNSG